MGKNLCTKGVIFMDRLKEIKGAITALVEMAKDPLTIQDMLDEMKIIRLMGEKNLRATHPALLENLLRDIDYVSHLLLRLKLLIVHTEGSERAVSENFKALLYATLEHVALRVGIAASFSNLFTLFTNVLSFVLNRVSEYAYVKAARESEEIYALEARIDLWQDLWMAVEMNRSIKDISYEQAVQLKDMIASAAETLYKAKNMQMYLHLYALLIYVFLLNMLKTVDDFAAGMIK
jgi:hypothetical protein